MNRHPEDEARQKFLDEIEANQKNILWNDTVRNGRGVDAFLWKGSPDATLVQRVGAWLFGLTFLGFGVVFLTIARRLGREEGTLALAITAVVSMGLFLVGGKICLNGFQKVVSVRTQAWLYAALVLFIVVWLSDSAVLAVGALIILTVASSQFHCPHCRRPVALYKDTFWPILPGRACSRCGHPCSPRFVFLRSQAVILKGAASQSSRPL